MLSIILTIKKLYEFTHRLADIWLNHFSLLTKIGKIDNI